MVSILGSTADVLCGLAHIDAEVSPRRVSHFTSPVFFSSCPSWLDKVAEVSNRSNVLIQAFRRLRHGNGSDAWRNDGWNGYDDGRLWDEHGNALGVLRDGL